jgi:hypothetical protein
MFFTGQVTDLEPSRTLAVRHAVIAAATVQGVYARLVKLGYTVTRPTAP